MSLLSVRLYRLMHSPFLSASLLAACMVTSIPIIRFYQRSRPIDIPGVNVGALPTAIVICYRPGCGCEAHTQVWAHDALQTHTPVFVLSQQYQPDVGVYQTRVWAIGGACFISASCLRYRTIQSHWKDNGFFSARRAYDGGSHRRWRATKRSRSSQRLILCVYDKEKLS